MLKRQNKDYHEEIIVDFSFKTNTVKNPRPEEVALLGTPKKEAWRNGVVEYWRNGIMEENLRKGFKIQDILASTIFN
jgi:hypothetical protein